MADGQLHEAANGSIQNDVAASYAGEFKTARKTEGDSPKSNYSGRRRGKETVFQPRQVALAKFLEVALKIVLFPV